ncbi:Phospholipase_D-nuclease N-terminal [Arthrobacter subterraneus]|jgi:hypothetical protein|uniref:Phospholipase_D-nuclease N-terminal n=1 Tax=Arthrobacter subterraneus TaxID=335973 RepID=A0A1G8D3X1_9MICC|nr:MULTISPECIES: PLD nuclease N-terminal domain-containing protein [Arthrobacter]SDH52498.1 Phospholipase_D-nuclease N-terminal [Arthrobacter subterraneus]
MPRLLLLLVILGIAVIIYALFDCIMSRAESVRSISKPAWFFTILLVPLLGAGLWFLFGRPRGDDRPSQRQTRRPSSPDDDPQFLRNLEVRRRQEAREAELRRREAENRAREAEQKKKDEGTANDGKTA